MAGRFRSAPHPSCASPANPSAPCGKGDSKLQKTKNCAQQKLYLVLHTSTRFYRHYIGTCNTRCPVSLTGHRVFSQDVVVGVYISLFFATILCEPLGLFLFNIHDPIPQERTIFERETHEEGCCRKSRWCDHQNMGSREYHCA